jgi:hypothetical protein
MLSIMTCEAESTAKPAWIGEIAGAVRAHGLTGGFAIVVVICKDQSHRQSFSTSETDMHCRLRRIM